MRLFLFLKEIFFQKIVCSVKKRSFLSKFCLFRKTMPISIYRGKFLNMQFKFPSSLAVLYKKKEKVTDISSAMRFKMEDIVDLKKEFEKLNKISLEEIDPKETFTIATSPEVVKNHRNRYKNILPFDSNVVMLDTPKGNLYFILRKLYYFLTAKVWQN